MNLDRPARPIPGPAVATPLPISITIHAQLLRRLVEDFVSSAYRIERLRLQPEFQRARRSVFPRQVVMYLLHVVGGLTLTDIGDLYRVNRRTVAHACVTIEDARDEPRLDRVLDLLEQAIIACFQRGQALPLRRRH
jgi:chromosomal replication initiation ATPase DnaA